MKPKLRALIISGLGIAMLAALFFGLSHFTPVRDYFLAASYSPSDFATAISSKLALSDRASLILRATHPSFPDSNFTEYCAATTSDPDSTSVLGCYSDGKIYVYRIDAPELEGITESTTAHELLHATWERLSRVDQDQLLADLNQVYKSHYDSLKIIDTYPTTAQASELYARVGSEITDLPPALEAHFATYFKDRQSIVAFYNAYAGVFKELKETLDDLETSVSALAAEIAADSAAYEAAAETFRSAAADFNACAETPSCFATDTEFYSRRSELVAEQDRLDAVRSTITAKIAEHNDLVDRYNNNLIRRRNLTSLINSNQEKENLNVKN